MRLGIAVPAGLLIATGVVLASGPRLPGLYDTKWAAYEYIGPEQSFHPAVVTERGLAVDDSQWTIDTPEDPDSILAALTYMKWTGGKPIDLTGRRVTVTLRGEDLELHGAHVTFWINSEGNRWHLERPLSVTEDARTWSLSLDGSWRQSWTMVSEDLPGALKHVNSYGFAFIGFTEEVTGRLVIEQFRFD